MDLETESLASTILPATDVHGLFDDNRGSLIIRRLCMSHERMRAELQGLMAMRYGDQRVLRQARQALQKMKPFFVDSGALQVLMNRLEGVIEMTPEEADAAYNDAPAIPISPERIDEMVRYATGKNAEFHNDNE